MAASTVNGYVTGVGVVFLYYGATWRGLAGYRAYMDQRLVGYEAP
jgi:hypothetical protein